MAEFTPRSADAVQGVFLFQGGAMTSEERREARYQRRKVQRAATKEKHIGIYDNFDRIIDIDNLYQAFKDCKKNVSWKESVQRYEANALKNVIETRKKLIEGKSIQSGFVEFNLYERGKKRHIKSIHISERIVQKCLCDQVIVPLLSSTLIYDNGASIKDKGLHFAVRRLITHLCRFYRQNNFSNEGYALFIDFSGYFDSIDHDILLELENKVVKDPRIRQLLHNFVTIFGDGVSLGLGSQVSQISAIYFPNQLDHFIKEKLGIKYYGRYMDDLYLIHADKEYLKHCLREIEKICDDLKLTINKKKTRIVRLGTGIIWLKGKYTLLPSGKILKRPCKGSAQRTKRKLRKFRKLMDKGKMKYANVRESFQSWRGNFKKRFHAYRQIGFMDRLYWNYFVAERAFTEKKKKPARKQITPQEYEKQTGKPYPDNAPVFVLDNDDNGCSFWVRSRYGKAKHLSLPIVCDGPIPPKPKKTLK
jgi:hypothetical protein